MADIPIRVIGEDRATPALQQAGAAMFNLRRSLEGLNADFTKGRISEAAYAAEMAVIRNEATALSRATHISSAEQQAFQNIMRRTGGAGIEAQRGLNSVRGALGTLAATTAGLPGRLGEVSSILMSFSFGSLATAGVFLGLATVALAYKTLGSAAREAKEEQQKALDKLIETAQHPLAKKILEGGDAAGAVARTASDLETLRAAQSGAIPLSGAVGAVRRQLGVMGAGDYLFGGSANAQSLIAAAITAATSKMNVGGGAVAANLAGVDEAHLNAYIKMKQGGIGSIGAVAAPDLLDIGTLLGAGTSGRRSTVQTMLKAGLFSAPPDRADEGALAMIERELVFSGGLSGAGAADKLSRVRSMMNMSGITDADLPATGRRIIAGLEDIAGNLGDTSENVKISGQALVGAIAISANALAGMITGRSSVMGGMGGITAGLSQLAMSAPASFLGPHGMALGIASIGFSFLDALTSGRSKDTMRDAHLEAMREFEREKPPANIFVNIDPFDPTNRRHQRLVDEARREAAASGYNARVSP